MRRDLFDFLKFSFLYSLITVIAYRNYFLYFVTKANETIGVDATFYLGREIFTSKLVHGHFFTLKTSLILEKFLPRVIEGFGVATFFFGFIGLASYLYSRTFLKRTYLLAILLPFSLIVKRICFAGSYAQLYSISWFLITLHFWFNKKEILAIITLALSFLSHFWAGGFLTVLFSLYILVYDFARVKKNWKKISLIVAISIPVLVHIIGLNYLFFLKTPILLMNTRDLNLIDTLIMNGSNVPSIPILVLALAFVFKSIEPKQSLKPIGLWFLLELTGLIVLGFGNITHRLWVMTPFVFVAVFALEKIIEEENLINRIKEVRS